MTNPKVSITCDQFAESLADFLERDVDDGTRTGVEAHAAVCAECASLLADLRALRLSAANLPELSPSRDLWQGIAARIETPVVELKNGASIARPNNSVQRRRSVWIGLAAAGLVAVTATVTHELTKRALDARVPVQVAAGQPAPFNPPRTAAPAVTKDTATPTRSSAAAPTAPTATLVSTKPSAEQTYDNEIARLRVVVDRRRPQLDAATVAVIEHNLHVIDDAIRQCKNALRKDPGSRFLMESLNDALDNKVQLLRTAATLPSKA
jgi:hypothetical protein